MKIKLECAGVTYDLIEELKKKVDREPNDISSWKSLVDLLEIKIGGLEGQIKVLEERQEMLVETNKGLAEEIGGKKYGNL